MQMVQHMSLAGKGRAGSNQPGMAQEILRRRFSGLQEISDGEERHPASRHSSA